MLSLVICLVLLIFKAEAMDMEIGAVILTANNRSLSYVTSDPSINYHGEVNYIYEDGEDLYFSCKKADVEYLHWSEPLRLEYYSAEGTLLFQTKHRLRTPHIFRSVLKSNNDKYYLDCICTAEDTGIEYRYRTNFYMKKRNIHTDADHHAMTLSVNGQTLTVITNNGNSSDNYDEYLYRYIDGEVLNVTCRKTDKNIRGTLTFNNYDEEIARYISLDVRRPLEGHISLNVSTTKLNKKTLTFGITNSDIQKLNARLLFLSDIPGNGVRIRGLSTHNILYQYTNDEDKWTIEYQYSVNDNLNLTCVSKDAILVKGQRFQWEFNGETSISEALLSPPMIIIVSKNPFSKILDATHNGKTINCVYIPNSYYLKPERVEIILRLQPGAKSGEIISSQQQTLSNVKISAKSLWLILGSSTGAVLIILGLTGAGCWYVRTRNTRSNIETPYGDLTYQNNSPTPQYTNECENEYSECYSEIPLNRDDLYETPGNVKNNMDPDNHYSEIDQNFMNYRLVVPSLVYDGTSCQK